MDPKASAYDSKASSLFSRTASVSVGETTLLLDPDVSAPRHVDHDAEKALCRKLDFRLLPMLAVMYFFNALDKSNLSNAKTAGLEETLGLQDNQYNTILSIFYIPYVLFAPPLAIIGKKYGPSRVLPAMMFSFGIFTLLVVGVKNFSGLLTLRCLLGWSESAFFPLVIYYQTLFYRRGELGRRLAIFYAASNVASAFSGLLAFAVFHIHSNLAAWRYLFLIEGSCTILMAIFAYWYLPRSAAEARFLSPEEKRLALYRIQVDSSSKVNEEFKLRDSLKIFNHASTWAFLAIEVCLGVPLQSVALFLPQIVARLGYSTVMTNLYTVAPNVSGAVVLLILAFGSDGLRIRFPFIAIGFCLTFIGFIIYYFIDVEHHVYVAYYATFMMTWGTSAPSVLLSVWFNNNVAHEGRRVVLTSVGVPLANLMGVVSSHIFQNKDAPKYIPALATTAAFGVIGAMVTTVLGFYMMADNKTRDIQQGTKLKARDIPTELLREGPSEPGFRWLL